MKSFVKMKSAFSKLSTMRMTRAMLQLGDEQLAMKRRRQQKRETEKRVKEIAAYREDYMKKFWKLRSSSSVLNHHGPSQKKDRMPTLRRGKLNALERRPGTILSVRRSSLKNTHMPKSKHKKHFSL